VFTAKSRFKIVLFLVLVLVLGFAFTIERREEEEESADPCSTASGTCRILQQTGQPAKFPSTRALAKHKVSALRLRRHVPLMHGLNRPLKLLLDRNTASATRGQVAGQSPT
jgi:hypothetical protein